MLERGRRSGQSAGFLALESADGRFVHYLKSEAKTKSPFRRSFEVLTQGGDEAQVLESVVKRAFMVKEGFYFDLVITR